MEDTAELVRRLERHPHLKERIKALLNVAENSSGLLELADDAEEALIVEVQKMGNELLQTWASGQAKQKEAAARDKALINHSKKNCTGNLALEQ